MINTIYSIVAVMYRGVGSERGNFILFNWLVNWCCFICAIMPVIFASYLMQVDGVLLHTEGLNSLLVCWNN